MINIFLSEVHHHIYNMSGSSAGLRIFLVLVLLRKGLTVIQTQQTVVAAVGGDARLSCQLLQLVRHVTWQKILPEGKKNVAIYNEHFGSRVTPDFIDKVEIIAGLQSSSIVVMDVTEQDGGCYLCLFTSLPDGDLTGKTCLQLYELHEPILHVRESNSSEESVVSCSATGRPAPTVTLNVSQPHLHLSHYNTVTVNNNGTVTVNTTAVLSGFPDNGAQIGCAARVLSVHKEVLTMILEVKQTPTVGFDEESAPDHRGFSATWIVLVVFGCVAAAVVFFTVLLKHNHKNSPPQSPAEENKTPQKTTDSDESQTPLVTLEKNQFRLSTTPEQHQETNNPELPSTTARRLVFEEFDED